jgi:hypothetical protein
MRFRNDTILNGSGSKAMPDTMETSEPMHWPIEASQPVDDKTRNNRGLDY